MSSCNCTNMCYHIKTHQVKYIIFSITLLLFLLGIVLTAVGNHETRNTMVAIGILILMTSIIMFVGYVIKLCCCPDKNICCEEQSWETYGEL